MANQSEVKADWRIVELDDLPRSTADLYAEYRQVYKFMKDARTAFENKMTADAALPDHLRLVFGYNFGKLSIAVVPNTNPKPKAAPATSLADFLAQHSRVRSI